MANVIDEKVLLDPPLVVTLPPKRPEPGDRVGVILSFDRKVVNFVGWGVYEGNFLRENMPSFEDWLRETDPGDVGEDPSEELLRAVYDKVVLTPRLRLDDGREVWDSEVWWDVEKTILVFLQGRTVINVDLDACRRAAKRWNEKGKK